MLLNARHLAKLPTDVYRCFDDAGALLYVGVSVNAYRRLREHRYSAPWWPRVRRVVVERYPNRIDALRVEAAAIEHERPSCNGMPGRCLPPGPVAAAFERDEWEESNDA